MTDLLCVNHGTIVAIQPKTQAGRDWVNDNLSDDALWFGLSVIVEPRYFDAIAQGAHDDGLNVGFVQ